MKNNAKYALKMETRIIFVLQCVTVASVTGFEVTNQKSGNGTNQKYGNGTEQKYGNGAAPKIWSPCSGRQMWLCSPQANVLAGTLKI